MGLNGISKKTCRVGRFSPVENIKGYLHRLGQGNIGKLGHMWMIALFLLQSGSAAKHAIQFIGEQQYRFVALIGCNGGI